MSIAVRIIVDNLGLSTADDVQIFNSQNVRDIHAMRERIRQRLRSTRTEPLVLSMPSDIFRRFANLEGQPGLAVEHLSPRAMLRERIESALPAWLTEKMAADIIGRIDQTPMIDQAQNPSDRILSLIAPGLLSAKELGDLLRALLSQPSSINKLLSVTELRERVHERCRHLGLQEADELLAMLFRPQATQQKVTQQLALMALRHRLEALIGRDNLAPENALPPRVCTPGLAERLPLFPVAEEQAYPYPVYLSNLLKLVERRIQSAEIPAANLADYVLQDWPTLIETLQTLFEQNPAIASEPMIVALRRLNQDLAKDLAIRLREYLDHSHCDAFPPKASITEVLRWSERYFHYARGTFERNDEPESSLCKDFAQWVVREQPRIIQSDFDWRVIARNTEAFLAEGKVVILVVVDALSAMHFDLIELALRESLSEQLELTINPVFGPLPTMTEVAKTSVLTGQLPGRCSADMEKAVRERFADHLNPDGLQIVKGWKSFREPLQPTTRLLICFDNRIDDDLHQCTEYRHHRERVRTVIEQLAKIVGGWQLDAARHHLDAAVIMTADHGATKVSVTVPALPGTEPIESRLLATPREPVQTPEDFAFVPGVDGGYLIPYARVAFGSARTMLHGGLTPEEVLIPFVLVAPVGATVKTPLGLEPLEKRCHPATSGWYVKLKVSNLTRDTFYELKVVAKTPFKGGSLTISTLGAHEENANLVLNLESEFPQHGLTQVAFELRYQGKDELAYERLQFQFDLDLAGHLLERTDEAQQFDDFFDL